MPAVTSDPAVKQWASRGEEPPPPRPTCSTPYPWPTCASSLWPSLFLYTPCPGAPWESLPQPLSNKTAVRQTAIQLSITHRKYSSVFTQIGLTHTQHFGLQLSAERHNNNNTNERRSEVRGSGGIQCRAQGHFNRLKGGLHFSTLTHIFTVKSHALTGIVIWSRSVFFKLFDIKHPVAHQQPRKVTK